MSTGRAPLAPPFVHVDERRHSRVLQQPLAATRRGIMLHYDDSSRDDWALDWFQDPRCTNGYTWVVLDDGRIVELADPAMRTPHAGPCLTPNANSAFYGIAATTNALVVASEPQLAGIATLCAELVKHHGWPGDSLTTRLTGHDAQAIWTAAYTHDRTRWGTLGRKVDPTGTRADMRPIIDVPAMRRRIEHLL